MRIYTDKICPVCGYDGFESPPMTDDICPCCLFTFDVNDIDWTYDELRVDWIEHGAKWAWGSKDIPQPQGWNPIKQLRTIGYTVTEQDLRAMGVVTAQSLYVAGSFIITNYRTNYEARGIIGMCDVPEHHTYIVNVQNSVSSSSLHLKLGDEHSNIQYRIEDEARASILARSVITSRNRTKTNQRAVQFA